MLLKQTFHQPLRWKWQATCSLLLAHSVAVSLVSLVSWVLVLTLATTMAKRWLTTYLHSAISSATKVVVLCSVNSSWAMCSKSNFQNTFAKSSTTNTRLTAWLSSTAYIASQPVTVSSLNSLHSCKRTSKSHQSTASCFAHSPISLSATWKATTTTRNFLATS